MARSHPRDRESIGLFRSTQVDSKSNEMISEVV